MRISIQQPNYAPWCGYFAKMQVCDIFVFLDDVQMPGGSSYVSRCRVRIRHGLHWLSVPVHHGLTDQITQVRFADRFWARRHLATLRANYARCPYFNEIFALLEPLYRDPGERLSSFNMRLIQAIAGYLGLPCRFVVSSELDIRSHGDDRLIALCRALSATTYVSGRGGQNYQNPIKFAENGIDLQVRVYRPIAYPQILGGFEPGLSILDALCHLGKDTMKLLVYQ